MSGWIAAAIVVVGAANAAAQYESGRKAGSIADDQAIHAQRRQAAEERIAKEKKDLDIELATEQFDFEKSSSITRRDITTGLISDRDEAVRDAAIAGFSASEVDPFEKNTSALAVLNRIAAQSEREQDLVEAASDEFIASRVLQLDQLKRSRAFTFETFLSQSRRETGFEVSNRQAEASLFRQKGKFGAFASISNAGLGVAGRFSGGGTTTTTKGLTNAQANQIGIIT